MTFFDVASFFIPTVLMMMNTTTDTISILRQRFLDISDDEITPL
jgi:hypothetical protein